MPSIFAVNVCAIDIAKAIHQAERQLALRPPLPWDRLSTEAKQFYIDLAQRALEAVRFQRVA